MSTAAKMENNYDVGIANRFALFLEEGESSLTAIKKKYSKELRAKNKRERKENAENKKAELVEPVEKPKPEVEETAPLKKGEPCILRCSVILLNCILVLHIE